MIEKDKIIGAINTREALILAAGELFAEHGFDGVSTRQIAERAGVNLGGIHYHFGSKEQLYIDTFRYICSHKTDRPLGDYIEANPNRMETPQGMSLLIEEAIIDYFRDFLEPKTPEWHNKLLIYELSNPSKAMQLVLEEVFRPWHQEYANFYMKVKPNATEAEASAWAFIPGSQVFFYILARPPLDKIVKNGCRTSEYEIIVAKQTARMMIQELGLPLPNTLMENKN